MSSPTGKPVAKKMSKGCESVGYYKHVHASTGAQTVQLTQKAPTAIKVATDFSGMEGPVLAMRRLGNVTITHVMASDIDANCRRVIAEVSPHAKIFEDALSRSVKELPVEIDCYVFCFPCQEFSRAGTGNGVQNIRGTCWIAGLKVIKARKPRCVVAENVAGLLEKNACQSYKRSSLAWNNAGMWSRSSWSTCTAESRNDDGVCMWWQSALTLMCVSFVGRWHQRRSCHFQKQLALNLANIKSHILHANFQLCTVGLRRLSRDSAQSWQVHFQRHLHVDLIQGEGRCLWT